MRGIKVLHTADWHVGKAVRGRSRAEEHRAVLDEIVRVADIEDVDLVLVVGDLFDATAPAPESEQIVYGALLALAGRGRRVAVVAGNHDNAGRLAAVAPVFESSGVVIQTSFSRPDGGGVLRVDCRGTEARVALVPFLSPRWVVRAEALMGLDADDHVTTYVERMVRLLALLHDGFSPGAVNLVAAHCMVAGGAMGGGERPAQTVFEYAVPAQAFPADAQYVALGHLHRAQRMGGAGQIWYSGSPLQLDFGEQRDDKVVHIVEAVPGEPASVRPVVLREGRRFRTLRGTLAEIEAQATELGDSDDFVRVIVTETARADLGDLVRDIVDDPVEIRVEPPEGRPTDEPATGRDLERHSPVELFGSYLSEVGVEDERLVSLFTELYDEHLGHGGGHAA